MPLKARMLGVKLFALTLVLEGRAEISE